MNRNEIIENLRAFLAQETNFRDPRHFAEGTDLIGLGILDSLLLMSLIMHCEQTFDCVLTPEELTEDQVRSIGALADTVMRGARAPERPVGS